MIGHDHEIVSLFFIPDVSELYIDKKNVIYKVAPLVFFESKKHLTNRALF